MFVGVSLSLTQLETKWVLFYSCNNSFFFGLKLFSIHNSSWNLLLFACLLLNRFSGEKLYSFSLLILIVLAFFFFSFFFCINEHTVAALSLNRFTKQTQYCKLNKNKLVFLPFFLLYFLFSGKFQASLVIKFQFFCCSSSVWFVSVFAFESFTCSWAERTRRTVFVCVCACSILKSSEHWTWCVHTVNGVAIFKLTMFAGNFGLFEQLFLFELNALGFRPNTFVHMFILNSSLFFFHFFYFTSLWFHFFVWFFFIWFIRPPNVVQSFTNFEFFFVSNSFCCFIRKFVCCKMSFVFGFRIIFEVFFFVCFCLLRCVYFWTAHLFSFGYYFSSHFIFSSAFWFW